MKLSKYLLAAALMFSGVVLSGCRDKGPAEKAGERLDEAGRDTKRAVQDAAD